MYYKSFSQYVEWKLKDYNADIKDEGEFCRVIPDGSMSVAELRQLFAYLNVIEDINASMQDPNYIIVEHTI